MSDKEEPDYLYGLIQELFGIFMRQPLETSEQAGRIINTLFEWMKDYEERV